jgi:hypothetical protein
MQKKINFLVLDTVSSVLLGLGFATLLLPFVLYLGLHADNDAYIEVVKWGGGKTWVLAHLNVEQMLRLEWFVSAALLVIASFGLRYLLWNGFPSPMQSQGKANEEGTSKARLKKSHRTCPDCTSVEHTHPGHGTRGF